MDKQSSPPGREILVLPQQTVHTVHLSLQWEKVKLGKDLQCSSKAYGWVLSSTCCKDSLLWLHCVPRQPHMALLETPLPRSCVGLSKGTERKCSSENITLTQTIADRKLIEISECCWRLQIWISKNAEKCRKAHLHHRFARTLHTSDYRKLKLLLAQRELFILSLAFSKVNSKAIQSKQHAEKTQLQLASCAAPCEQQEGHQCDTVLYLPWFLLV